MEPHDATFVVIQPTDLFFLLKSSDKMYRIIKYCTSFFSVMLPARCFPGCPFYGSPKPFDVPELALVFAICPPNMQKSAGNLKYSWGDVCFWKSTFEKKNS